jgi:peptidyl-tRNA hydrolase
MAVSESLGWYEALIEQWTAAGWFDGDLLLVPSAVTFLIIGILMGSCLRRCVPVGNMGSAGAVPAASKALSGPNLTRSGKRRTKKPRRKPADMELKMVMVVRKDLKLKADQVAVGCAQAAIDAVAVAALTATEDDGAAAAVPAAKGRGRAMWWQWLEWWNEEGTAKVVVRAEDLEEFKDVVEACIAAQLPYAALNDAIVAVGPAPVDDIDDVCGHFKLF